MDWKDIAGDSREKYQLYLASREWGLKKEAVLTRCGGICERCGIRPVDHVHHRTYARKYAELLEDLQGICKPCHDFSHGRSGRDPRPENLLSIQLTNCPHLESKFGDVSLQISQKAFDANHLTGQLSPTETVALLGIQQTAFRNADAEAFFSRLTVSLTEREVGELIDWLQEIRQRMKSASKREAG